MRKFARALCVAIALGPIGCGGDTAGPQTETRFSVTVDWSVARVSGLIGAEWAVVQRESEDGVVVLLEGTFDGTGVTRIEFGATCRDGAPLTYPFVRLEARFEPDAAARRLFLRDGASLVLACTSEPQTFSVGEVERPWPVR